jgi:SlyX protein
MMDIEKRIIDLETKISFQDQTIEDLHDMIYKQQQQITQLEKAFENFHRQIKSGENDIRPNEKPPHY